ncbi:uncharacterized protein JCM6883_001655 [Sporobolomyces salmoneus]|uniref:uncharacterized protein n=1 Tax=Sporobolomyces salmoneus TaxID=183962 RepID=UPI003181F15E
MLSPITSTLALLSLLSSLSSALPTGSAAPEFDEILSLSPRDLVPAYLDKRDVPDYPAPKPIKQSIAYFPSIETPSAGSVWSAGSYLTVAWNNTKPDYPPEQIHNFASLLLGFRNADDPASGLNLDIERPLANISLYGSEDPIEVQLPDDLVTRSTYLLVLGSTANMSPLFTIEGIDSSDDDSSSSARSSSQAMSTRTIVAAASSSSSSSPAQRQASRTTVNLESPSASSRVAAAQQDSSSSDVSPSPSSEDNTIAAQSPSPSPEVTYARPSPSSSSSSSRTQSVATPISASGGALAASSTPTSGGSSLTSTISIAFAGIVALACMI